MEMSAGRIKIQQQKDAAVNLRLSLQLYLCICKEDPQSLFSRGFSYIMVRIWSSWTLHQQQVLNEGIV